MCIRDRVGGLTIAMKNGEQIHYQKFPFFDTIYLVACIPGYTLSTEEMRKILPANYSREDVIFNLSRIAYLMGSICRQDREGFFSALDDAIHPVSYTHLDVYKRQIFL